ncbi:polysaccharide biosynthesis/export family protein [Sphingomonas canadensis]|uniref:Polysaccharide biosynthesis/export family protein n=1 Tax=Sphingomonas canadensis TaxID=1219257 RepID=A0ABW3HA14_9SPHN|nr:polysaccharide biosynthesis/export family protein [Sphingomonas canadensis]MCW3835397.1 polysaccharide export protein [Sphingomonas canadensis]
MKFRPAAAVAGAFLAVMLLSGCEGRIREMAQAPGIQMAPETGMPRPQPADRLTESEPLLIGAFDKIDIDVYGVQDLHRAVTVDASGTFLFPLVGEVQAAGRDPRTIVADLTERLRPYVKNPQVSVNVVERVSQALTVDGQVLKPGQYQVIGRQTLMRAVATAGGTSEYARLDDVVIFRTVGGQRYVGLYNLAAIRRGNYEDPEVFANDIVIVGDSKARRMFQDFLAATPVLTAPLILLLTR